MSAWTVYVFRANSPSGSWQRVGEFIRRRRVPVFGDRTRLVALTSMTPALLPLCWSLAGSGLGFHRLQAGRGLVLVVLGGLAIQGAAVVAASWVLELLRGIEHKKWLRRREQRKRDCPHSYSFRPLTGVRLTMEAGYDPPDGHMVCSLCGHEYPIGGGKRRPDLP